MGKIRTRVLGLEDIEEKQKKEQKVRAEEKKRKKGEKTEQKEVEQTEKPAEDSQPKVEAKAKKTEKTTVKSRGKKYLAAKTKFDEKKLYSLTEAVALLNKIKYAGFDESVELHFNVEKTGLKGEVELPHATGKVTRVKVVDDALLANLEKGVIDFDVLIAHPSFMPKLAKFAKLLGPKGLMPNPKAGTISPKPDEVVKKFAKGTLRFKTEPKFPLMHQMIGNVSLEEKDLVANAQAFFKAVGSANVKKVVIKTTMSPGVNVDLNSF